MSDYEKDLERFLDKWELLARDMRAQERLRHVAQRQGDGRGAETILNRLDADYKRLRRPDRPTRGEIVDLALDSPRGTGPAK